MFDLPHVASRLYGTPLFVANSKLESILSAITPRLMGDPFVATPTMSARSAGIKVTSAGIAVIPVLGTLVRRASGMSALCGMTSYQGLADLAADAFTDPAVHGVLLEIDSCGGEAGGLFDFVDELRSLADATGKPLWAVANEAALSAAYAIACAAEKIYLTRTAEVGSVGVVALHVDESGADNQAGLSYTYIHAGARKVDGNPHEPLSEDVHFRLQEDVDKLYEQFVGFVAKRRKACSPESVRATEAGIYRGKDALAEGFADVVGTFKQAHDALVQNIERQATKTGRFFSEQSMEAEVTMAGKQQEVLSEQQTQQKAPTSLLEKDVETVRAEVEAQLRSEMTEVLEITEQAKRLGIVIDPVTMLSQGTKPDALRRQIMQQAASMDEKAVVKVQSIEKPEKNGLVAAAKKYSESYSA